MNSIEDFRLFLPQYLSPHSGERLFESLKQFPQNIDSRFYMNSPLEENAILQGDGIDDLLVINLPETRINPAPAMILSNSCDIDLRNRRPFESKVIYAPIFNLQKYRNMLLQIRKSGEDFIEQHIASIRRQEITQIFYLPACGSNLDESFVFLDRVNNCSMNHMNMADMSQKRKFRLSNYGFYIFLFKLSFHFNRIAEGIDRG